MVLWVGKPEGKKFGVTKVLVPRQRGIKTKDGVCVVVESPEMHRINVELFKSGLRVIAQVHTHPTNAYHSDTDDEYAIATTAGSLSLVIPDFARRPFNLMECAVYRLDKTGIWQDVPPPRARALISIEAG